MRLLSYVIYPILTLSVGSTQHAAAQCPAVWSPGPVPLVEGVNGPVLATTMWDPDGGGPGQSVLVVGGGFTAAAGVPALNIATFDGQRWRPLGFGLNGAVRSLAVYQNHLIAGGDFTTSVGEPLNSIARWNGFTWQLLGSGMSGGCGNPISVWALKVYNNELIAGGNFCSAGGAANTRTIARWNGVFWQSLPGPALGGGVCALTVYNNQLIFGGGDFYGSDVHLARWDGGASWEPLLGNNCPFSTVRALTTFNGELIVGGIQVFSGGACNQYHASARFDGTNWYAMPGLVQGTAATIFSFGTHNSELYAGGFFLTPNSQGVFYDLARWSNGAWEPMAVATASNGAIVFALASFGGQLLVGGEFDSIDAFNASNLAAWTGSAWQHVSPFTPVRAIVPLGSVVILGGDFNWPASGGGQADYLCSSNGNDNFEIGNGLDGPVHSVLSFVTGPPYQQHFIVGGEFFVAGGFIVNRVVQMNSFNAWFGMGAGFNNTVHALTLHGGQIYAAGAFSASGATALNHIARWDGNNWQPLADGGLNGSVYALASHGGFLYAGGSFTNAGGSAATYLARWNGTTWGTFGVVNHGDQAFGSNGPGSGVYALSVHNGVLRIGGRFTWSVGLNSVSNLIGWNGASWSNLGSANDTVRAMASHNGDLYAGGDFTTIGGVPANRVAKWTSTNGWQALGAGVNGSVLTVCPVNNRVHVGGSFSVAGGQNAPFWAIRQGDDLLPIITSQPQSDTSDCGGTVTTYVSDTGGQTYEWRRYGVILVNGATPQGATINGATTNTLTIANAQSGVVGSFDVIITNDCGSITSDQVMLTLNECPPCPADVGPFGHSDGIVNIDDLLTIINNWGVSGNGEPGDVNGDGIVNIDDLLAMVNEWGVCP